MFASYILRIRWAFVLWRWGRHGRGLLDLREVFLIRPVEAASDRRHSPASDARRPVESWWRMWRGNPFVFIKSKAERWS